MAQCASLRGMRGITPADRLRGVMRSRLRKVAPAGRRSRRQGATGNGRLRHCAEERPSCATIGRPASGRWGKVVSDLLGAGTPGDGRQLPARSSPAPFRSARPQGDHGREAGDVERSGSPSGHHIDGDSAIVARFARVKVRAKIVTADASGGLDRKHFLGLSGLVRLYPLRDRRLLLTADRGHLVLRSNDRDGLTKRFRGAEQRFHEGRNIPRSIFRQAQKIFALEYAPVYLSAL